MNWDDALEFTNEKTVNMLAAHLEKAQKEKRVFHPKNWRHMAQRFAKELDELLWFQNSFYVWKEGAHRLMPDAAMESKVSEFFSQCYINGSKGEIRMMPNSNMIMEIMRALRNIDYYEQDPPHWLNGRREPNPAQVVSFPNGLLDVKSGDFSKPTSNFFTLSSQEFEYDPDATEPVLWKQFLDSIWPDDPQSQRTLMEYFGYLLSGDTSMQKMLMIVGPPATGKSTIIRVMEHVLGRDNCTSTSMRSMNEDFGLSNLMGKSVAFCPDETFDYRSSALGIDRLRQITGCDTVVVRMMRQGPIPMRLPIRFVFTANETPRLRGTAEAMLRRFVILRTPKFEGPENTSLPDLLCEEAPGILNMAIAALKNLHTRGTFVQPSSGEDDMEEIRTMGDGVAQFIRECVMKGEGEIDKTVLYGEYISWAEINGEVRVNNRVFGKALRAAFPGIKDSLRNRKGVGRYRVWPGLVLAKHNDPKELVE